MASRKLQFRDDALLSENTNAKPSPLERERTQLRSMVSSRSRVHIPRKPQECELGAYLSISRRLWRDLEPQGTICCWTHYGAFRALGHNV